MFLSGIHDLRRGDARPCRYVPNKNRRNINLLRLSKNFLVCPAILNLTTSWNWGKNYAGGVYSVAFAGQPASLWRYDPNHASGAAVPEKPADR